MKLKDYKEAFEGIFIIIGYKRVIKSYRTILYSHISMNLTIFVVTIKSQSTTVHQLFITCSYYCRCIYGNVLSLYVYI